MDNLAPSGCPSSNLTDWEAFRGESEGRSIAAIFRRIPTFLSFAVHFPSSIVSHSIVRMYMVTQSSIVLVPPARLSCIETRLTSAIHIDDAEMSGRCFGR